MSALMFLVAIPFFLAPPVGPLFRAERERKQAETVRRRRMTDIRDEMGE